MNRVLFLRLIGACITACFTAATIPAIAQEASNLGDCALARDPVRCVARADAIAACADLHGPKKRDCLLVKLPPPDCNAAPDSQRCQQEQDAREACRGKENQALRNCLHDQGIEAPKKAKAQKKKAKPKSKPQHKPAPRSH